MPKCPTLQAADIGVPPRVFAWFIEAFESSNFAATSLWPFKHAMQSGVLPSLLAARVRAREERCVNARV